jgi:hypothetical protein
MLTKYLIYMNSRNKFLTIIILLAFSIPLTTFGYSESVYSGIKKLEVSPDLSLEIESYFKDECDRERDLCLPSNRLFLIAKTNKTDHSGILSKWNNYTYVYFVKISKDKYLYDLDHDGNLEFALYPMIAGNNPVTDAYVYSVVGDKIVHYGMGRFHFEWGPDVKKIVKGEWIEPHP